MSQYSRIIRTILITGLAFAVNILITLLLVPYITEMIGTEAYGWVKAAKDAINYCTMLMLVIQEFSTRFIGVNYHNGDYKKANVYFNSAFFGDIFLGMLLFTVIMVIVVNIDSLFKISPDLTADVQLLFLFTMLKFLQMTSLAVFECGPMIANRMNVVGRFKLFSYLTEAAALLLLFHLFEPRVYLVGLALLLSSIVTTVPNILICRKYTPKLHIRLKDFDVHAVGKLVGNGIWASLNTLNNFLNSGCDMVMTNLMLAPLQMGQIAIIQSISAIITSLYAVVAPAFQPKMLETYSHGEHDQLMRWSYLAMKTCGCLCSLFFAGFLTLGYNFYELWIPEQDIGLLYRLTVIALVPAITLGIISPMFYIYTLTVKRVIPFIYSLATGVLNVASMIVLLTATDLGLYAVVGTTTFFMILDHMVANGLYVCHVIKEPLHIFYGNVLRCLAAAAVMTGALVAMDRLIRPEGILMFIICVMLYSVVGILVYGLVVFSADELKRIISMVKSRIAG